MKYKKGDRVIFVKNLERSFYENIPKGSFGTIERGSALADDAWRVQVDFIKANDRDGHLIDEEYFISEDLYNPPLYKALL